MSHIFIAYSKKNNRIARELSDQLRQKGFEVWIDDRISLGDEWWKTIVDAIKNSAAIIVIMSPEAEASRWVRREIMLADEFGKPTYPILIEGQNWPFFVSTHYIDAQSGITPNVIAQLTSVLSRHVKQSRARAKAKTQESPPTTLDPEHVLQHESTTALRNLTLILTSVILVLAAGLIVILLGIIDFTGGDDGDFQPTKTPNAQTLAAFRLTEAVRPSQTPTPNAILTIESIMTELVGTETAEAATQIAQTELAESATPTLTPQPSATPPRTHTPTQPPMNTGISGITIDEDQNSLVVSIIEDDDARIVRYELQLIDGDTGLVVDNYTHEPPPYKIYIPLQNLTEGRYTVVLRAFDSEGQVAEASPLNFAYSPPPTPTITPTETPEPSITPTPSVTPTPSDTPTLSVDQRVEGTVVALLATEEKQLSPAEASELLALTYTDERERDTIQNLLIFLSIAITIFSAAWVTTMIFFTRGALGRLGRRASHPSGSAHDRSATPEQPQISVENFQVFVSSSDQDKDWVAQLVDALGNEGFEVWWYAKDAPGLPFGEEIVSAIFSTKVFIIVISPDSMSSKHVEEEIRFADLYNRPIINVVYRPTTKRLYGLAKGADIDFSNPDTYDESLEYLAQAIDHHLGLKGPDSEADDEPAPAKNASGNENDSGSNKNNESDDTDT